MATVVDGQHRLAALALMTEEENVAQVMSESVIAEPESPKVKSSDLDPNALRGALYLDEHHPGWANKIDLERFDIRNATKCVVGQIAGYYDGHAGELFPVGDGYNAEAESFGILPLGNSVALNRSWKILIAERQSE